LKLILPGGRGGAKNFLLYIPFRTSHPSLAGRQVRVLVANIPGFAYLGDRSMMKNPE